MAKLFLGLERVTLRKSGGPPLPLPHRLGKEVTSAHVLGMPVAGRWMHLGGQVGWILGSTEVVVGP